MADISNLRRELEECRQAVVRDLLEAIRLVESIPEQELNPELRALQDEQRIALRESLMKVTGDADGRQLRQRLDEFNRSRTEPRKAG